LALFFFSSEGMLIHHKYGACTMLKKLCTKILNT
jgi:hypothetical protein